MKRRHLLRNGWGLGLGLLSGTAPNLASSAPNATAKPPLHWRTITFTGMGTVLSIQAAHTDASRVTHALQQSHELVARLESQMSVFDPNSALSRLNAHGVLEQAPSDLLDLMRLAHHYAARSQGAFDPTVQPLWTLFANRHAEGRLPSELEVEQARQRVDWHQLHIQADRIALKQPGMAVTLNGIAQGYASDRVRTLLQTHGIEHALINTGEWSALGQSSRQQDWVLGVADPHQADALLGRLRLQGGCLATSADDQTYFSADHVHHHIFDPRTGYSPRDVSSVTVLAPRCAQADALTKVLFVAGYERALSLAQSWHVAALVVHKSGRWQISPTLQWA